MVDKSIEVWEKKIEAAKTALDLLMVERDAVEAGANLEEFYKGKFLQRLDAALHLDDLMRDLSGIAQELALLAAQFRKHEHGTAGKVSMPLE